MVGTWALFLAAAPFVPVVTLTAVGGPPIVLLVGGWLIALGRHLIRLSEAPAT
jgi:hypothetical protein